MAILRQRQYFRRNTQHYRESYNAKKMLALPSNPDSYELSIRFFFFLKLLKFLIVNETRMFLRMSLSRTCQLNVCVIFLLFQWPSLPFSLSFYGYVINWNMFLKVSLIILVPKILGGHYSLIVNRFFTFKKRSTWWRYVIGH